MEFLEESRSYSSDRLAHFGEWALGGNSGANHDLVFADSGIAILTETFQIENKVRQISRRHLVARHNIQELIARRISAARNSQLEPAFSVGRMLTSFRVGYAIGF